MIVSEPKLEDRSAQHYVGIRNQIPHTELPTVIPQSIDEVMDWLQKQGIQPTGAPFIRYHVIDMAARLDIEVGWPVAKALSGNGRIAPGVLPAGRYAALVYRGVENGIKGNGVLIDWANENGIKWDRWDDPNGDAFASRYEIFLTGPEDDPDPAKWDTEVAIKLADPQ